MTTIALSTRTRICLLGLMLAAASPALAQDQGTAEQREACAPDAITLCQDTIPDVPKTTACMQAHLAQLSPKCRALFSAATEAAPAVSVRAPESAPRGDGLDDYRAMIAQQCKDGIIDPYTCKNTMGVLNPGQ